MAKKNVKAKIIAGAGAGIAAAAAIAAGANYLYGKDGRKHRKELGAIAARIKAEAVRETKKLGKANRALYEKTVATVAKRYKDLKKIDTKDVAEIVGELKGHWDAVSREISKAATKVKKVATAKKPSVRKKKK